MATVNDHRPIGWTAEQWAQRVAEVDAIRARAEAARREREKPRPTMCRWVKIGDRYHAVIPCPETKE